MPAIRYAAMPVLLAGLLSIPASAAGEQQSHDPLRFFEGRTESISIVKAIMHKPYRTRAIGVGRLRPDGTLDLLQRVERDGEEPRNRRWVIREVGKGRFAGTMSEAVGPVNIEEVGGRYRFRFKMKGNVSVEQWLTPLPGGKVARSNVTIRKLGMTVGRSDGTIRKL